MKKVIFSIISLMALTTTAFAYEASPVDYLKGNYNNSMTSTNNSPHANEGNKNMNEIPQNPILPDNVDIQYPNDTNHLFSIEEAIDISNKSAEDVFSECILKSGKMIEVLDVLRTIPEPDRIKTLFESGYWNQLSEAEKDRTMKILANFNGVGDDQYDIIKGQVSESLKEECLNLLKKIKSH